MLRDFDYTCEKLNLNNYHIFCEISQGVHSRVFRALDKRTNQELVMKLFEINKSESENFIKTIKSLQFLNLPYICKIINFRIFFNKQKISSRFNTNLNDNSKILFVIVEEFMKNGDIDCILKDYISSNGQNHEKMNPTIRNKIIFGVASTMKLLHKSGFLHRNLTTNHILLDENFEPKISLSCFSYFLKEKKSQLLVFKGSLFFMAPELMTNINYSYPVDVYSYSIILYRMFSNSLKFSEGFALNRFSFLNNILHSRRLKRPQNIPDTFWELIRKCWNDDPDERPTFSEITEILKDDKFALDEYGMKTDLNELHKYQNEIEDDIIPNKFSFLMSSLIKKS